jgi:S-adenosylmethionine decarboxylase
MSEYQTRGQHVIADLWGVEPELLNDAEALMALMNDAVALAGATVLKYQEHSFEPQGVTALLLLSESHMSVHTYPERGFVAFDCYTCGNHVDPQIAIDHVIKHLEPVHIQRGAMERGVIVA